MSERGLSGIIDDRTARRLLVQALVLPELQGRNRRALSHVDCCTETGWPPSTQVRLSPTHWRAAGSTVLDGVGHVQCSGSGASPGLITSLASKCCPHVQAGGASGRKIAHFGTVGDFAALLAPISLSGLSAIASKFPRYSVILLRTVGIARSRSSSASPPWR